MNSSVLLCADETCIRYPETIGLSGENLFDQPWLNIIGNAQKARDFWNASKTIREVWVVSADDMEAINIAAACKADRPDVAVQLVSFSSSGSCNSRASQAKIDSVLDERHFVARYSKVKQFFVTGEGSEKPASDANAPSPSVQQTPHQVPKNLPGDFRKITGGKHQATLDDPLCEVAMPKTYADDFGYTRVDVSQEITRQALLASRTERHAFFLPIVSGSGGCGKSTIAVLAACIAQNRGYKTLLLDMDLQFGDTAVLLGTRNACSLDQVAHEPELLNKLEVSGEKPAVIAAPRTIESSESLQAYLPEVLQHAFALFDVVIANTGSFWTEQHIKLLEQSTKALFLIDQRPSSLRACRHALDLCERCGVAANPFVLGVNRCQKSAIYSALDVSCAMQGMKAVELREGGREVEECLAAGQPQELLSEQNELCRSIDVMLSTMLPQAQQHLSRFDAQSKRKSRRFFGKQRIGKEAACL